MLAILKQACSNVNLNSVRTIARIPHYERHIRFDPSVGRKRPCYDVLDRFKRLNNGIYFLYVFNVLI